MVKLPKGLKLRKGEKVFWSRKRCWRSYSVWLISIILWLLVGLLYPMLILLGIALFIFVIYKRSKTQYTITNHRICKCTGPTVEKVKKDIKLKDIYRIEVERDTMGEIFNYGSIILKPLEDGDMELKGVYDPDKIAGYIRKKTAKML